MSFEKFITTPSKPVPVAGSEPSWIRRLAVAFVFGSLVTTLAATATAGQSPRFEQPDPAPEIQEAVGLFMEEDPSASFSYFNGRVDSYSSRPKPQVPAYAVPVLQQLGLPWSPKPTRFLPPAAFGPRPSQNLDADLSRQLPFELESGNGSSSSEGQDDPLPKNPELEGVVYSKPVLPPESLPPAPWQPPSDAVIARERVAVKPILAGFLGEHEAVFELDPGQIEAELPGLQLQEYNHGRYARRAVFSQTLDGMPLIGGRTVVLFDHNWNVVNVSRMLVTPEKLAVPPGPWIEQQEAEGMALQALEQLHGAVEGEWRLIASERGFEPVRGKVIWQVRWQKGLEDDSVRLDATNGEILNISSHVDRFGDAKVRRWAYSNGALDSAFQVVSDDFYTRDDRTLVHDFFHLVNDERMGGDAQTTCDARFDADTSSGYHTNWTENAYDTTTGSSFVRPTRRSDRDFSLWSPAASSGTFGESNTYFWSRWFFQWLKPTFRDLGVLPSSAANYPRVLIVNNACLAFAGLHSSSFGVTTLGDVGEGTNVVRLPHLCRRGNPDCTPTGSSHTASCEGDGCYSSAGLIHHELNHFVMKRYFGIGSGIDCGAAEELKHLHEGAFGHTAPHAFWHNYYGIGYAPSDSAQLYRSAEVRGRPHTDSSSLNHLSDFPCIDDRDDDDYDPYKAGSVVHQALWKLYHGVKVNGSTTGSVVRPATDNDFLNIIYWAADLVAASTYKDRWEMANRVMQTVEMHSNLSSFQKGEWCDIWRTHGLDTFIWPSYCS